ncbi:alkaline phosphatase family protein [Burkholderia gladioli]|uniref:alkaline phosphatase family protein n=1 Tax=Burkholderia gladioli TaxID=28095 RepID=UPI000CFE69AE|nr:alkaline phosphatase family protein [Burkholderia gladioli]MBU9188389.1 alkaline phosphatase family protein [Burkholderia gladioli]MBU9272628.1 alkaline phosphatase family protein [Burkholderia gladioli]MBU9684633.1 alkaline phosphatase family protein [Burkholderia gladioli]MDD1789963.1 alkaline phosphatase family protein [Burkholderia gladioli]MDN7719604.1 alkaline phosphatase family protein [Burkholderia gladioli]
MPSGNGRSSDQSDQAGGAPVRRVVTVICDSLRRDLLSEARTPVLWRLAQRGTWFSNARSVFPSTTRTSSASIATGCHPARHGLAGNCVILSEGDGLVCCNVGNPTFRDRLEKATGQTLRVPVLAEYVKPVGHALIMSNVSAGAAYFHDPDGHGEVFHRAGSYGPGRIPLADDPLRHIRSGADGDAVMTGHFVERLKADPSLVAATLWLSEPDHSGHRSPLGSPEHLCGIDSAQRCVARVADVVDSLREAGQDILMIVGSDHGMQTVTVEVPVIALMVAAGLKDALDSREVVLAPNGTAFTVGIADACAQRVGDIAAWLREQPWVGAVYTGEALGKLGLASSRECRIAVTMAADESRNPFGVAGGSAYIEDPDEAGRYLDRGQHGGLGAREQSPFLFMSGRGFEAGAIRAERVSLVDYLPTALAHLHVDVAGLDGRPLQLPRDRKTC